MMELLPFILKALMGKYKTVQPTRTETITTITSTAPAIKQYRDTTTQAMVERAKVFRGGTVSKEIPSTGRFVTPTKPIGIMGGPPVTITKENVTYSTGPAKRIRVN